MKTNEVVLAELNQISLAVKLEMLKEIERELKVAPAILESELELTLEVPIQLDQVFIAQELEEDSVYTDFYTLKAIQDKIYVLPCCPIGKLEDLDLENPQDVDFIIREFKALNDLTDEQLHDVVAECAIMEACRFQE